MIRGQGSKPLSFQAEMTHRVGSQSKSGAVAWWIQHDPTINKVSFRERKRLGSNAPSLVALVTFGHSSHTLRLKERFIASNPTLIIWYHMLGFRWIGMGKQCAAISVILVYIYYIYTYIYRTIYRTSQMTYSPKDCSRKRFGSSTIPELSPEVPQNTSLFCMILHRYLLRDTS